MCCGHWNLIESVILTDSGGAGWVGYNIYILNLISASERYAIEDSQRRPRVKLNL